MAILGGKSKPGVVSEGGRFRTFGLFILVVVLAIGGMSYFYYKKQTAGVAVGAAVSGASGIVADTASEKSSPEFVKLVRQQNLEQAERAKETGDSALSSVVRPSYFDSGDFETSAKKGCSVAELKRAKESGVSPFELRCKGCSSAALKAAGFSAGEMAAAGFSATELKSAGFTAKDLKAAGFSAAELKKAGFDVTNLASAGYSAAELAQAGYTPDQLKFAGFSDADLAAAGIGVGVPPNMPKDCSAESLARARESGISAAQLQTLKCGAAALKAAGFTAAQLKAAGFTAAQLKAAGFRAQELKAAGFSAGELMKAGFVPQELRAAGFSANELRDAGVSAEALAQAGYTADQLKAAGFSEGDLYRAGIIAKPTQGDVSSDVLAAAQKKSVCNIDTARTLRAQGVSAGTLIALGCQAEQLKAAGYSEAEVAKGVAEASLSPEQRAALASARAAASQADDLSSIEPIEGTEESTFLSKLQSRQEAQLNRAQREDQVNRISAAMRTNAQGLFTTWTPPAAQEFQVADEEEKDKDKEKNGATAAQTAEMVSGGAGARPGATTLTGPTIPVTAGTIMFGCLDTGVNSDEESPVLVSVVSGQFKGAKMIGTFKVVEKKLVLNFSRMSLPWHGSSVGVKVVAVDPDTARTALAHHVDNHYFLRYGTLFASSFMSGLAQAISQSGSTTSATTAGVVTTTPQLDTTEKILVALGEVGTQYANVLGQNFNRKPTVTVEAGQGVGLLFMDDAQIPMPNPNGMQTALQ